MSYLNGFHSFDYIRWHTYSTDVVPKGGSKAEGIKRLLQRTGIDQKNTFAFGNAPKLDIQMLHFVDTGIAMGNGRKEAKDCLQTLSRNLLRMMVYIKGCNK